MIGNYIITGATSGIGKACAKSLAVGDNTVFIVGRDQERLERTREEINGNIITIKYDLENCDDISSIFDVVEKTGKKLNGFIYSAGMDATFPIKAFRSDVMLSLLKVNCVSFIEMSKFFYSKRISADGASIVAISSLASLSTDVGMVAYSASKAALNASVRTISKEFVRRRIRVNAIMPGGVSTRMAEQKGELLSGITEIKTQSDNNAQPFGIIPPESIVSVVGFLLSDESKYMTGELIPVSAGRIY